MLPMKDTLLTDDLCERRLTIMLIMGAICHSCRELIVTHKYEIALLGERERERKRKRCAR